MKLDELKTAIGEVLKEQIDALKQPAGRKAFIEEAGSPEASVKYLRQAAYYGKVLGLDTPELKNITDEMLHTGDADHAGDLNAPPETLAEIARIEADASVVARLCRSFPQDRDIIDVPVADAGLTVTYTGEAEAKTVTVPTFKKVRLTLKKPALIVVLSDEMLQGSVVNLVDYINTQIGEDFGTDLDTQVLGASSTPYTNINENSLTNVDLPAAGPDFDSVVNVTAALRSKATRRARWFMSRSVFAEFRKVKGTDGQPIFQQPFAGSPGTLMGYPVEIVDVMPAWGTAGNEDMVALFGDLGYWYMGRGKELQIGVSREASVTLDGTMTSLWQNNLVGIRAEARRSGALVLPEAFCRVRKIDA